MTNKMLYSKLRWVRILPYHFSRHEKLCIAFVHLLVIVIFLAPTFFRSKLPLNSDYLLHFAPWNSVNTQAAKISINPVLSDSIDFALPNRSFFNTYISKGDFPLWNPYISTGTPFGFLVFTDTFSIANLTALIAGVMWGRVLYHVLKLFILGYFIYLYLRQKEISVVASYLGAVTASFASYIVAYLSMHVIDSVVFLPALFYFGELFYTHRSPKYFIASAFVVTLMLVSGFPSITFYAILFASTYFAFRVIFDSSPLVSFPSRIRLLFTFVGVFLVGLLLAAFSLVPTIEFFNQVNLSYREGRGGLVLSPEFLWRLIIGNFFGNPIDRTWYYQMNFNETALYSGILPLLFLPFSWLKNKQRKTALFFGIVTFAILSISFGIGPWNIILNRLPFFNINANYRMIALLPVCLGIIAAIGLHNLSLLPFKTKLIAILSIYFGGAALLLWYLPLMNPWNFNNELNVITRQFKLASIIVLTVGLLGIIYIGTKKELHKHVISIFFVLIAFFDLGYQHHDYNGLSDPTSFFPETPGISYLVENQPSYERMLPISNRVMVPSFPLYYSINSLFGHWWTSPEFRESVSLIDPGLFNPAAITTQPIFSYNTLNLKSPLIDIYRIKHVVIAENVTSLWEVSIGNQNDYNSSIKLSDLKAFSQSAVASRNASFDYILLRVHRPQQNPIKINFRLRVGDQTIVDGENLLAPSSIKGWFKIEVPEQRITAGQEIEFFVSLIEPEEEGNLYIVNFDIYPKGTFTVDQKIMNADSAFFLVDYDEELQNKFKLVYSNEIAIYENVSLPDTLPIVLKTKLVDKEVCTKELAKADLFSEVLITQPIEFHSTDGIQQAKNQAQITYYSNDRVQIHANMNQKGIIVLSDTWFPGWIARVDGVPQEIFQVNCNMRGLVIEPGSHIIEMRYEPRSIILGITISLITLVVLISFSLFFRKKTLS